MLFLYVIDCLKKERTRLNPRWRDFTTSPLQPVSNENISGEMINDVLICGAPLYEFDP